MFTKNYWLVIVISVLLAAGVATNVFFWKRITTENQRRQDNWQSKTEALSAQISQQKNDLMMLQNKLNQFMRSAQQNATAQTLNEIAYLLDVANLYLQINHDIPSAVKSLQLAQQHVQTLADPSLLSLQQALASDLNSLNDAKKIDTADILLKLQTLSESIGRLQLVPQQITPPPSAAATPIDHNLPWYQQYLNVFLKNFKNLFAIRYSTSSLPILPPDQREWVRENITFTLAQAQWAVLQQKSALYQQSLTQVNQWITHYFPDNADRKQILARLTELLAIDIAVNPPDINASLHAVQQALKDIPLSTPPPIAAPEKSAEPTSPVPSIQPEKTIAPPAGVEI